VLAECTDTGTESEFGDLNRPAGADLEIQGNGHTIEQTCAGHRVMEIEGANNVVIMDLTITGGDFDSGLGGGISFRNGSLTIVRSSIVDNHALGSGGAINADFADVTLVASTVSGNSAANT